MDSLRRTTMSVCSCLALLAAPALTATPAHAAPPPPVVYDALGDSYASGYGVLPAEPCGRSAAAYPRQLDGRMRISLDDFDACAGATVQSMLATQLDGLDDETDLVTISIGGNNIGWVQTVAACLLTSDPQCAAAIAASTTAMQVSLPPLLDEAFAAIASAAPDAQVVVTGYARFFEPEAGAYLNASPAEQQAMNDGADLLNSVLATAAAHHGFQFVDVTRRFEGHAVNSAEPYLQDLSGPGPFHPNQAGYDAYTAALTAAINPRDLR